MENEPNSKTREAIEIEEMQRRYDEVHATNGESETQYPLPFLLNLTGIIVFLVTVGFGLNIPVDEHNPYSTILLLSFVFSGIVSMMFFIALGSICKNLIKIELNTRKDPIK